MFRLKEGIIDNANDDHNDDKFDLQVYIIDCSFSSCCETLVLLCTFVINKEYWKDLISTLITLESCLILKKKKKRMILKTSITLTKSYQIFNTDTASISKNIQLWLFLE